MHRSPDDPAPAADAAPATSTTWVVRPGDHFWAIAERTLTDAWGRAPSDREIDPFWRAVIERNRANLRDPNNADLLFPGDTIEVPTP